MKKIVIIGGGIAGLAAAYRIQEEIAAKNAPLECVLVEAADRFGGKIATDRVDGFIVERGPDSFISQKPAAIELCRKLGLGDRLTGTNKQFTSTFVYTGKKMQPMPDGLSLLVPTRFMPFVTSPLFSWPGKIRMGLDLFIPKGDGEDESLASFVRRRLGEEALKKMAEPMLAGIYASDPERMSIRSTFPAFCLAEQKHRSLILGMLARARETSANGDKQRGPSSYSLFMTLENGLEEMVTAIIEKSPRIKFCKNAAVRGLKKNGARWLVTLAPGEALDADAVVLATPANHAAGLLEPTAREIAERLLSIRYVSTATVSLAYRKKGFSHPLDGYGFVVPKAENRDIMACTWTSTKFPHRAPDGHVMLRCFVGGALREDLAHKDEPELTALARKELREIMGITEEPLFCRVYHNKKSNVQYYVGHEKLIDDVHSRLAGHPGLFLAGSAYRGIGIPDCIANGARAAEAAAEYVAAMGH